MKAFMSQTMATRCEEWPSLAEAEVRTILAESEPHVARLGVSTPTEQYAAGNLGACATLPEVAGILAESIERFLGVV